MSSSLFSQEITINQLNTLIENNQPYEYFSRFQNIKLEMKSSKWRELNLRAAMLLSNEISRDEVMSSTELRYLISLLSKHSVLRSDEFLRAQWVRVLSLKQRFQSTNDQSLFFHQLKNLDLSKTQIADIYLALMTNHSKKYINFDFWPLLEPLFTHKLSEFYCHKDPLRKMIWAKALSISVSESRKDATFWLKNAIHPDCAIKIRNFYTARYIKLAASEQSLVKSIITIHQLKKNEISKIDHVTYLLGSPVHSEQFNQSWAMIRELGRQPKLKQKILDEFSKLATLPDKLFQTALTNKSHARTLKHLNEYFPEYIQLYTKKCLAFLSDENGYGNPTPSCFELFQFSKEHRMLPKVLHNKFKQKSRL